jgi:cation diffusion facilitator family transporter
VPVSAGRRVAAGSIVVGCLVLGLKTAAWWLTGSAGLYSDALESTVNVAASVIALLAIWFAEKPADANHPYGHEKAEFFAAVLEGTLIVVAALSILEHAWGAWNHPTKLEQVGPGLGLNLVATGLNAGWAAVLLRLGPRLRSEALRADGRHLVSDVVTSLAIVIGVGAAVTTGLRVLDPATAAVAAIYVLWSGMRVLTSSVSGLMDAAPADVVVSHIRQVVAEAAEGAIEAHDLRMRSAGRVTFMEFHLVVPAAMSVADAHAICDRVEAALKSDIEGLVITIHVEPEGKAKHHGVLVL